MRKRQVMTEGARACASPGGSIPATPPRLPQRQALSTHRPGPPKAAGPAQVASPLVLGAGSRKEGDRQRGRCVCMVCVCVWCGVCAVCVCDAHSFVTHFMKFFLDLGWGPRLFL